MNLNKIRPATTKAAIYLALCFLLKQSLAFAAVAPVQTMGTITGTPGAQVTLPISFDTGGASVSAIQFSLSIPSSLTGVSITSGSAIIAAGKSIVTSHQGNNWNVLIYGFNQTAIGAGQLAILTAQLDANTPAGTIPLVLSNIVYADPLGQPVAVGPTTNGAIQVQLARVTNNVQASRVYPNPWRADKHLGKPITFANLNDGSKIKIFTASGHLVRELNSVGGTVEWDRLTDKGDNVASGIYIYLITDNQGTKTRGKLGVVR